MIESSSRDTEAGGPVPNFLILAAARGALDVQASSTGISFSRLPAWTRAQFGDGAMFIEHASSQLSGARLEFETVAQCIEVDLTFTRLSLEVVGVPLKPAAVSVTTGEGYESSQFFNEGNILRLEPDSSPMLFPVPGSRSRVSFQLPATGKAQHVTLWLPHNSAAEVHSVRADEALQPSTASRPRWVHYGSSISQASEADTPLGTWPAIAARSMGLDILNLGLAGSAHLDPFVARTIRDGPADLITLKVGINVVNGATMRSRTFAPAVHGFLDTIREGHASVPIVVLSPISCPAHEDAPGPTIMDPAGIARADGAPRALGDGQLTLQDIRETLASICATRSSQDPNLHYLDGRELFGADDVEHLPDGLHPDAYGQQLMGDRFLNAARESTWFRHP